MIKHHWMKFWTRDWRSDTKLRCCSLAARGMWMELITVMFEAEPYGHLLINGKAPTTRQIGVIASVTEKEAARLVDELEDAGVFSRDRNGTIFSRRMVRDREAERTGSERGQLGGNPDIIRGSVPLSDRKRRFRPSDAPAKTKRIWDKSDGRCHWCKVPLSMEAGPTRFQVDHVIPIRDGGSNEDNNLVASCSDCNHDRARYSGLAPFGRIPTLTSDPNRPHFRPLSLEAEAESARPASFKLVAAREPTGPPDPEPPPVSALGPAFFRGKYCRPANPQHPDWPPGVELGTHQGRPAPIVNGMMIEFVRDAVFEASGLHPSADVRPLIEWLLDGYNTDDIATAIRRVASRPGYRPPRSLGYFDAAIREQPPSELVEEARLNRLVSVAGG